MPTDTASSIDIIGPEFWTRPLEERMADFAVLREEGPFIRSTFPNPMTQLEEEFWSVTAPFLLTDNPGDGLEEGGVTDG